MIVWDLLSVPKLTRRVAFTTQCAVETAMEIPQNEVWLNQSLNTSLEDPIILWEASETERLVISEGVVKAWLPLCNEQVVAQLVDLEFNFAITDLDRMEISLSVPIPMVMAEINGTIEGMVFDGWWDWTDISVGPYEAYGSAWTTATLDMSVVASNFVMTHRSISGKVGIGADVDVSITLSGLEDPD